MNTNSIEQTYELSIQSLTNDPVQHALIQEIVIASGVDPERVSIQSIEKIENVSVYCDLKETAEELRQFLVDQLIPDLKFDIKEHQRSVWLNRWKEEFKPFDLTTDIEVIPLWMKDDYQSHLPFQIMMDTDVAFGTGLHETTRFMSQLIEKCRGEFETFLDIGTGTGILTIAAHYYGAKSLTAFDLSSDAIEVARQIFKVNNVPNVYLSAENVLSYEQTETYDFVAANLITHELIKNADKILSFVKPGAYLAVSGISREHYSLFKETYDALPLACEQMFEGERWVAVLFRKTDFA